MNATTATLQRLMDERDLNQNALARIAGVSDSTVSLWFSGERKPTTKTLQQLADYFNVSVDSLLGRADIPTRAILPKAPRKAYAPLYGRVHAGEAVEPDLLEDKIPIPYEVWENHKQGYFLEVEGDCMDKVYPPGCLVFIDPTMTPQNRSIAVVSIDGADYIMRRLNKGASTLLLSPESNNSDWQDIVIQGDKEVRMVGTVVWFQPIKELE